MNFIEEIKEYRICPYTYTNDYLKITDYFSIKELITKLQNFLNKNNVEDGYVSNDGDYGEIARLNISCQKPKTDEELKKEIGKAKEALLKEKEAKKLQKKQAKDVEYQTYLKLQKKYGKVQEEK